MKSKLIALFTALLTILAFANVASACGPFSYQPEVPSILKK